MAFDQKLVAELGSSCLRHLLEDVMPFWEKRTQDRQYGGYITCFDRIGRVTDTDKYIWFQARQVWMFSALYNKVEKRERWLELAKHGRDFLVKHAYASNGRWFYQTDRKGNVKKKTISIFTDHFVLAALCEYSIAAGNDEDISLIQRTYDTVEQNVRDPNFQDIYHGTWDPRYKRHGMYMITLNTSPIVGEVLGEERTRSLIDHCLEQVLYVFSKDDRRLLFESVGLDGKVVDDDDEGRVINPGHALESMWFCIEEGKSERTYRLSIVQ